MRSPNVFVFFTVQIWWFLAEIYDFEQFSWAPVQDFSKNTLLLERYWCIFSIFPCFLCFNQVLAHYLWYIRISLMFFWWFFNFWTSFADFGWIWSKIQHCFDAFSQCVCVFYYANLMIFSGNLRFWVHFVDVFYMVNWAFASLSISKMEIKTFFVFQNHAFWSAFWCSFLTLFLVLLYEIFVICITFLYFCVLYKSNNIGNTWEVNVVKFGGFGD